MRIHVHASRPRGFAALDPQRRREISSRGGQAAQAGGRAHRFTAEEARAAGRKGGQAVSQDRAHMAAIARRGRGHAARDE
ncbi:KGG domain-containing protein [Aerosticca soli]|jgi:general stress protein YciG|uniref:KGG domain-containing protein n=1 Tax=Aerosticca soli TaxID=2010829 RepID=UPI000F81CD76|nr:KGG domain-containing protein [Aerosticca soli]MDI3261864.1 KGG domain-containing protein [Fulvimonas sp.]